MKSMKKLVSLALCTAMLGSTIPGMNIAAAETTGKTEVQCESRYPGKPVGRSLLLPEVLLIPVFRNDNQEHVDPESVWTARIFPASDHPGSDAELSPVQKIP